MQLIQAFGDVVGMDELNLFNILMIASLVVNSVAAAARYKYVNRFRLF